jgi:arginyl-tRNA synthetase
MKMAAERGLEMPRYGEVDLKLLNLPEEILLIKWITRYPDVVNASAETLEPHRYTFYLNELAAIFHGYYNKHRVISDEENLSRARLFLVKSIGMVLRNALTLLGVTAPEKM